jgi:uncharacterized membrane protein YgcG
VGVERTWTKRVIAAGAVALGTLFLLASTAHASVDDFVFESFDGVYELDIAGDGTSQLRTTETLVAVFPDYDQNRGIARYLPTRYLDFPLDTEVIGVTDEQGNDRPWATTRDGSAFVIESVVPRGEFVRGRNTYVLSYRQDNVIRDFGKTTGLQEFYWDINGSGWPQPFGVVTATILIPPALAQSVWPDGDSCYAGPVGSTTTCQISREFLADGTLRIYAETGPLQPYETMTIAIGFVPETFTAPAATATPVLTTLAHGAGAIAGVTALVWALVVRRKYLADAPGRPVIVPEYLPPAEATISVAAVLRHNTSRIPLAGLLQLAVGRKIHLSEERGFGRKWSLVRRDTPLTADDTELLTVLLGEVPPVGQSVLLPKQSTLVAKRLENFIAQQKKNMTEGGLLASVPFVQRLAPLFVAGLAGVLAVAGFVFFGDADATGVAWGFGTGIIAMVSFAVALVAKTPLGPTGSELRDYLKGLRVYIRLAEKDRLHYLQSPKGAIRERVSADDSRKVLKLYERLLPWAVVLGEEKRWAKELDRLYRDQSPDWMTGTSPHLIASLGSFSQATSASFRSSSSGGTGGGGSAGGGGGGGGGGGR